MNNNCRILVLVLIVMLGSTSRGLSQQIGYKQTNLLANANGIANHTDTQLSNPWGVSFANGSPFWIANNNGGTSTLYDAQGNKNSLVVGIPVASTNPCTPGCPTGNVANTTADFGGGLFIFDTEDGIVANWTGAQNASVAFDNSANGAVYKGLALINPGSGNFLLAANFRSGQIDVLDRNFQPVSLSGSFKDPNLPAGFAPHGVHNLNNQIYVTYAMQDSVKHDPVPGAGSGIVDVFDQNGNFVKTLASGGQLNAPWGVVETPATFGTFSNAILVGNFGDGKINAFDRSGKFLGQVTDSANNVIVNPGLWDMAFGGGGTGDPNTLYFTAGGSSQTTGLFATLVPASAATTADFALALSSQSATIGPGQSATLTVRASAVGGFNGPISLSCSNPNGVTCSLSPATITPGSSTASSNLTLTVAATPPAGGYGATMGWLSVSGVGVFGMVAAIRRDRSQLLKISTRSWWIAGLGAVTLYMLFTVGCGGSSSSFNHQNTNNVTVTLMGTSGSIHHAVPITLTIR